MRHNLGAKPLTYPQPVYIIGTYDEEGTANAMNAAWGGISDTEEMTLCLSAGHRTVKNLLKTKAFTVSMGTELTLIPCDYVGIVSGNRVKDKVKKAGFTPQKAPFVNAPLFKELPMAVECTVKSYDSISGRLIGQIVNVSADESVMTDGRVDPQKLRPIVFDPVGNTYLVAEKMVGRAFSDGAVLKTDSEKSKEE